MPCTRGGGRHDLMEGLYDSDDDSDPDYREDSADDDEDELPPSRARDRAQWIVDNTDAVEELYHAFKEIGTQIFGRAFFQVGTITDFSHFVYNHTTPLSSE